LTWDRRQDDKNENATSFSKDIWKSTPNLSAISSRNASTMRNSVTTKPNALNEMTHTQVHPSFTLDYRPSSMPAFLSCLSTFKLSTYGNKPQVIDAVAASKCGWINDGKDRLFCSICQSSWVVVGKEGLTTSAGKNN
jgi:hypothetical protein